MGIKKKTHKNTSMDIALIQSSCYEIKQIDNKNCIGIKGKAKLINEIEQTYEAVISISY